MFESALRWMIDIGMAIGPILGYVSQYRLIKFTKSVGSFSIDICGILLFANILRLNFYIFKQYESALVFQSLFMIGMQILLLYECCKYPTENQQKNGAVSDQIQPALPKQQCRQKMEQFWRWKSFQKYGVTILFFVFCTFIVSFIFKLTPAAKFYGELIGLIALMSQSVLIAPQIIKNIQKQSTKGLSHLLVTFNLSGDIFKLVYFLINDQPFQFVLCGIIQVILDSFVIIQIFYYTYYQNNNNTQHKNQQNLPIEGQKIQQVLESQNNLNYGNTGRQSNMNEINPPITQHQLKQTKLTQKKNSKIQIQILKQNENNKNGQQQQQNYQFLAQEIESDDEQQKQNKNKKQISQNQTKYQTQSRNSSVKNNGNIQDIENNIEDNHKNIQDNQQNT